VAGECAVRKDCLMILGRGGVRDDRLRRCPARQRRRALSRWPSTAWHAFWVWVCSRLFRLGLEGETRPGESFRGIPPYKAEGRCGKGG
jgi:hypothetical protein